MATGLRIEKNLYLTLVGDFFGSSVDSIPSSTSKWTTSLTRLLWSSLSVRSCSSWVWARCGQILCPPWAGEGQPSESIELELLRLVRWYRGVPLPWLLLGRRIVKISLTHLPLDKMATISQIFSVAYLWMKSFVFWLKFQWSLLSGSNCQ